MSFVSEAPTDRGGKFTVHFCGFREALRLQRGTFFSWWLTSRAQKWFLDSYADDVSYSMYSTGHVQ